MLRASSSSLYGDLDVEVTHDAPIGAEHTWYAIGGRADALVRPQTIEALTTLVKRCRRDRVPLRVLGSGANLLVCDEGVGGIVLRLDAPVFVESSYETTTGGAQLRTGAGADLRKLIIDSTKRGYKGLEHLVGFPSTVGGAIRMNAGGAFGTISDHLEDVTCVTKAGETVRYRAADICFGYRATNIPDPIIVGATFALEQDDPIRLRERVKEVFAFKKSTQPLADSSAGCAFRNPVDPVTGERVSAGKLIDDAGLKGLSFGGASVSRQHANFIVAQPGAVAEDVIQLMEQIKRRVFEHHGIELETEVVIWRRGALDT